MSAELVVDALIDRAALTGWLDRHAPALGSDSLKAEFLHGGTSNVILTLDRGGARAVLRRPPPVAPPNSEQAMAREARMLAALNGTDVPHPHLHGFCEDLGVIGAPFYVMEHVDGWAPGLTATDCTYLPPFDRPEHKHAIGVAMTEALVTLAKVDYRAIGLEGFGKPDNFLERQVGRWSSQLAGYESRYPLYEKREIPGLDYAADWLRANRPPMSKAGVIHADYGPPNVLFARTPPVRLCAIVDWELATLGDPLLDMALFLMHLRDADAPSVIPGSAYFDPTDYPTRQELIAIYAEGTGLDLSHFDYYLVLAQFRHACILEYKVASAAGRPRDAMTEMFAGMVLHLAEQARDMAMRSDRGRKTAVG